MERLHASCVDLKGMGILLRGPSGAGKSDLVARLLLDGARLVADDQTLLAGDESGLWASAPLRLQGLLEVRGLGILDLSRAPELVAPRARVVLVADLGAEAVERLPDPETTVIAGVTLPVLRLDPARQAAVARLWLAARLAVGEIVRHDLEPDLPARRHGGASGP